MTGRVKRSRNLVTATLDAYPLTPDQRAAWASFENAKWAPFVEAWLERGLRWPPEGTAGDDARTSLRSRLWEIADAQPEQLADWIREARGRTAYEVIGYVFACWRGERAETPVDDWAEFDAEKRARRDAGQRVARATWARIGDLLADWTARR